MPSASRIFYPAMAAATLWLAVADASAQVAPAPVPYEEFVSKRMALSKLRLMISAEPDNLNYYFLYAKAAEQAGRLNEAVWAYQKMLAADPNLDRVRLDLSLVYIKLNRLTQARELLEYVLARNVPPQVQDNIRAVLNKLGEAGKRHTVTGAITAGVNYDTNANAAPSSGNVTVLDTNVPLGPGAQENSDYSGFLALMVNYIYQGNPFGNDSQFDWRIKSSAGAFGTRQADLDNLEVSAMNIRTGAEVVYLPWRLRGEVAVSYSDLVLDDEEYLRSPRIEVQADMPVTEKLVAFGVYSREYRQFLNSPAVSTYTDRSGAAWQQDVGLRYFHSDRSMWEGRLFWRDEGAKQRYNANRQIGLLLGHSYLFNAGYFQQIRVGYKRSDTDMPDFLISARTRSDDERTASYTVGKRFDAQKLTVSAGYNYTDVRSNIQNYEYDNHRVSVAVTKNY